MGMAALGNMLSSSRKTKGLTPTPQNGVVKVNKVKGGPREGQTYVDVTDAAGLTIHRYGVEGTDKDVAWNKNKPKVTAQSAQVASPSTAPAPKAKGGLVNQIKSSPRFGMSFKVSTRKGVPGHLYQDGTFIPMGKAKS